MAGIREYFGNIRDALVTTAQGMGVTLRHFRKEPPITVQYPHERLPLPPSYRGVHILDQSVCIDCKLCAKACPVDCIEIEAVHHGRVLEWQKFSIDYKKCIFCEFCIPPCPKDCIHMTSEYEMATDDPGGMVEDLLTWTGLRAVDRRGVDAAEAKKAGREAVDEPAAGPTPGRAAPSGVQTRSEAEPGGPAAPGGEPRGPRAAANGGAR
jgi:NADH-quinone oxidoreductase chain I